MNNIYVVRNENYDYDEYDALCLVAKDDQQARELAVSGNIVNEYGNSASLSCTAEQCSVKLVGVSAEEFGTVILSSFNAG